MTSPGSAERLQLSVIIPTRQRPGSLLRCLLALGRSLEGLAAEVIVVDDGTTPPLRIADLQVPDVLINLLTGAGHGPAAARNLGIAAARGSVLLFTDDDVVPDISWARAAFEHLESHPGDLGVDGPIVSDPWDPLFEHSLEASGRHGWTCNIAYRADVVRHLGGFRERVFPRSNEDTDLAARVERLGPIGHCPEMRVRHTPREIGYGDISRLTRTNEASMVLHALHPDLGRDYRLPTRLVFFWWAVRRYPAFWKHGASSRPARRRVVRGVLGTVVATGSALFSAVRTPPYVVLRRRHGVTR